MTQPHPISQAEWKAAEKLNLRCEPYSSAAISLVDHLMTTLPLPATNRPSTTSRRRKAIGALWAGLLELHAAGKIGSHGLGRGEFPATRLGFGIDIFEVVKDAMVTARLLHHEPGRARWTTTGFSGSDGTIRNAGGWVARFKLSQEAITLAESFGVMTGAWEDHWQLREASAGVMSSPSASSDTLIGLRSSHVWKEGRHQRGEEMAVNLADPALKEILSDLEAHNAFLISKGVTGTDFVGIRRLFNDGDRPARLWRAGGRFYSIRQPGMAKPYEAMSGPKRRKTIRIGGERVGEADISASQLRILYALSDTPMPEALWSDPYQLEGCDREGIKSAIAQALGKGTVKSKRWGKDAERAVKVLDFDKHNEAAKAAHPILLRLGSLEVPDALTLQYHESEIIRLAMARLRGQSIASLPVHDSLLVPLSHLQEAERALMDSFGAYVESIVGYPTNHSLRVSLKV